MKFTCSEILSLTHVQALGFDRARGAVCSRISTDSRSVEQHDLFIALRGEKFDGHNFITKAVESGASGIIADARWAEANKILLSSLNLPALIVDDTIRALGQLANLHRRRFKIPVLVVGGSNGKTTTKEMIAAVLKSKYRVLHTEGNLNNHIGVPQTLLRLDRSHQIAVIEIGTNHFGEIAALSAIAEPTHALITNIGREHLEFFGTIAGVAKAETEVFDWMLEYKRASSVAFINHDDERLAPRANALRRVVSYGFSRGAVSVKGKVTGFDNFACARLTIKPRGKKAFPVTLSAPGHHNALNALAAATVGLSFRVPAKRIQSALASFTSANKRMQLLQLNGVTVLNDTYNSNPDSVLAALGVLEKIVTKGKKIVVLGDMLELGAKAADEHRKIGETVVTSGATHLLTFGPLSKNTAAGAATPFKQHFDQKTILSEHLVRLISSGDVVLVKGSRGMKMEEVVSYVTERLKRSNSTPGQAA